MQNNFSMTIMHESAQSWNNCHRELYDCGANWKFTNHTCENIRALPRHFSPGFHGTNLFYISFV